VFAKFAYLLLRQTDRSELTMGHGSWVKWVNKFEWVTLTNFTLYLSGIPRDFLVYGKPATAIEIVILTAC